jgi:hypothetical protein
MTDAADAADTAAWFKAATDYDKDKMETLLAAGVDINSCDKNGRTALFMVAAPFGGAPELYTWLVSHGADVNIRDAKGESAVDFASHHVSSALENNMVTSMLDFSYERGYRIPGNEAKSINDYLGKWRILSGGSDGDRNAELFIRKKCIESDVAWLRLQIGSYAMRPKGIVALEGDHAGLQVTVRLERVNWNRCLLTWNDGVIYPAELMLYRIRGDE